MQSNTRTSPGGVQCVLASLMSSILVLSSMSPWKRLVFFTIGVGLHKGPGQGDVRYPGCYLQGWSCSVCLQNLSLLQSMKLPSAPHADSPICVGSPGIPCSEHLMYHLVPNCEFAVQTPHVHRLMGGSTGQPGWSCRRAYVHSLSPTHGACP